MINVVCGPAEWEAREVGTHPRTRVAAASRPLRMSQGRQAGSETRQGGERAVRQTLAILAVNMSRTGAEMKAR